jgi:type I restriction enzyme S subunit
VKAEWTQTTIGAAFRTATGTTPPKSSTKLYGLYIPFVKPPELRDARLDSSEDGLSEAGATVARLLPRDSVLVSCIGNLGKVGLTTVPVAFNQQINAILPDESKAIPEFMFYQALSGSFRSQLEAAASGTTIRIVNKSKFNSIKIVLPPLPEQMRIVAILDQALEAIESATENAENNEQNAQALFASCLSESLAHVQTESRTTTIGNLVRQRVLEKPQDGNHGELHPTKAEYVSHGVPFVMAADLQGGVVNTTDCRFISEKRARALRIGFAKSGDVLLSHKGTIGRVAMLSTDLDFVMLTPQLTYYRVLDSVKLMNRYLYYFLQSEIFQAEMGNIADAGSTRAYIGITRQLDLHILVPPVEKQRLLVERLSNVESSGIRLGGMYGRKIAALRDLKHSMVSSAFSGQLSLAA